MCFLLFCLPVTSVDTKLILPVLYGCESWSLTLGKERRLKVFENRMLRTIFGVKEEEVAGGWRRLHSGELHNLCTSVNVKLSLVNLSTTP